MKRFRKNNRGQFVVAAALLIALLTLSVALSIQEVNLRRQQLRYVPVEQLVLGITSDLDRSLAHALSIATQQYYESGSIDNAEGKGYDFMTKWVRSVLASYSHLGIKMNMNETKEGLTDVSWSLAWSREKGISQAYAKFDLDIGAYGFKGWVGQSTRSVTLKIFPESIALSNQTTTLSFQIMQGSSQTTPVPNLGTQSLEILAHVTGSWPMAVVPASVTTLTYLGGGNYTVTFSPRINEYTKGMILTAVTPEDGIYVSAYIHKDIFVTLKSLEKNQESENLGEIQLGDASYTLPNTTKIDPGKYLLRYFAKEGYTFLNWTTSGSVAVGNAYSNVTSVTVNGNGTVTAIYRRPPIVPPNTVNLYSREFNNSTFNLGTITLVPTTYTLPRSVTGLASGDYGLTYTPYNTSYAFLWWETSGNVIVWNPYESSTTLTVSGNGTVTAVYTYNPPTSPPSTVSLRSLEDNSASANLGRIQLGEVLYDLPSSATVLKGTYVLKYTVAEGYSFLNWTTSGPISVGNPYSDITSVTVNGNGTVTAIYKRLPITPPKTVSLALSSREDGGSTLNLGTITLGTTTYTLPASVTGLAGGDYALVYTPQSSSYFFLSWEMSGDVIVWNPYGSSTTVTVTGNGTLTAIYSSKPPTPTRSTVGLRSLEDNSASANLGRIQLGEVIYALPNSATVLDGTYILRYTAAEGYSFLNWTTSGPITLGNPYSDITSIMINGNGTVTAFYGKIPIIPPKTFNLALNSREDDNSTYNLGTITLGTTTYTLPGLVTPLALGDYTLRYMTGNASYTFQNWESSGDVVIWDTTSGTTTITIYGNATITAVYGSQPPVATPLSVDLLSKEDNSASANLGGIQLGGVLYVLPSSATVLRGTYILKYTAAEGYSFLNWTTSGPIMVVNSTSDVTSVTINGNGTVTAFYKKLPVLPPKPLNLALSSREDGGSTLNLGTITLGTTTYTLPGSVTGLSPGDYVLRYTPQNSSYLFLSWEMSGAVIVWNPYGSSTTVTVNGNGTITAVYAYNPPAPTPSTVSLRSLEDNSASANLGGIQLGEAIYDLPNAATLPDGTYFLKYISAEGYTFVSWTASGSITVGNSTSDVTSVTINGNGTVTAIYRKAPIVPPNIVNLYSREDDGSTFNLGTITLNTTTYTLPRNITGLATGDHALTYTPQNSSYLFLSWEMSGAVIVWNPYGSSTTVTVNGNGTITAIYAKSPMPAPATVSLSSLEDNSASANLGSIRLGEVLYILPNSATVLKGTYILRYTAAEGYMFLNWTTSGPITLGNSTSDITSVTVDGNGTVTAIYKKLPIIPPTVTVLDSRDWYNMSFSLGNITLGTNVYKLPKTITGLASGDYALKYTPYNASYIFLWWETSGNVTVWDSTRDTTTLSSYGNGTVTAVYAFVSGPPPPGEGEWDTLYVDIGHKVMPPYLWSMDNGKLPPSFSTGKDKQVAVCIAPPCPTIYLARLVNVTAYVRPNPPENVKDVTLEVGFWYNGEFYLLGNGSFSVPYRSPETPYKLQIDTLFGEFPEGYFGIIPEGSVIELIVTVTFFKEPWGSFFLYYGPAKPSCIELF